MTQRLRGHGAPPRQEEEAAWGVKKAMPAGGARQWKKRWSSSARLAALPFAHRTGEHVGVERRAHERAGSHTREAQRLGDLAPHLERIGVHVFDHREVVRRRPQVLAD